MRIVQFFRKKQRARGFSDFSFELQLQNGIHEDEGRLLTLIRGVGAGGIRQSGCCCRLKEFVISLVVHVSFFMDKLHIINFT